MTYVFKIFVQSEWADAHKLGVFHGSKDDLRDGFIHLSTADQLDGTLTKHFSNKGNLILVAFDAQSFDADLVWEPSRNGDLFPHLYAELDVSKALWSKELSIDRFGMRILPEGFNKVSEN